MNNLDKYQIQYDTNVLDALKKIDANKKGFVFLLRDGVVVGSLSDGDIRRAFIKGCSITTCVSDIAIRDFVSVNISEDISKAVDLFKNVRVRYLPILDEKGCLVNIVTKNQIQSLLLQDIYADLSYDFDLLDENLINYEVNLRPWGFFKTTILNDYFQSKILSVKPLAKLSLQSHSKREEYWIVTHGNGIALVDGKKYDLTVGTVVHIPKHAKHRLINCSDKYSLIVTEVQLGEYFGEDDIVRYEDDYGRGE